MAKLEDNCIDLSKSARDRLLDAGAKLFAERGFKGAPVRDICELAGTGNNMIHHYFKNKQGLFDAIFDQFTAAVFETPIRIIKNMPDSKSAFINRFELFVEETLEALITHHQPFIMIHKTGLQPSGKNPYAAYFTSFVEYINFAKQQGYVSGKIEAEMLSGLILDRLGNQILFSKMIDVEVEGNVILNSEYKKRWLRANLDLFLYGFIGRD